MLVHGSGTAGDTVKVYDGTSVVGTAAVSVNGFWSLTTSPLGAGTHSLSAKQTDPSGTVGTASPTDQLTVSLGSPNSITFYGNSSPDSFTGGAGNDTFVFSAANLNPDDWVNGGGGTDTLLMTSAGAVWVNGVRGVEVYQLASGASNTLTLSNLNFNGVPGATIQVNGGANGNTIDASSVTGTNDLVFVGGAGDDIIQPSTTATMTGGAGNNQFTFADIGTRTITDFGASAGNELVLRNSGFNLGVDNGLGTATPQHLDASVFVADAGGVFTTPGQRFAYDPTSGTLYYDANGSGTPFSKSAVVTLTDHATLSAGNLGNLYFRT